MGVQTTGVSSTPRSTRRSATKQPQARRSAVAATLIDPDRRRGLIAEAAYLRAERRGFEPGHEDEDWLAAEVEIDTALTIGVLPPGN